eukprot:ANDGO_03618.mRNA.1 hypothetical protein
MISSRNGSGQFPSLILLSVWRMHFSPVRGVVPIGALYSSDRLIDVNHENLHVLDIHHAGRYDLNEKDVDHLRIIGWESRHLQLLSDDILRKSILPLHSSNDDRCCPTTPCVKFDAEPEHCLIRVGSTVRLHDLNGVSSFQPWEQSVSGAASTGTHGSGIFLAPVFDYIATIEIVCVCSVNGEAKTQRVRIESPTCPITSHSNLPGFDAVIRDDDVFHAARVSLGTAGVITAVVLAVQDRMFFREARTLCVLNDVLKSLPMLLLNNRHVEILLNPYETSAKGKGALVITRNLEIDGPQN